MSINSGKKVFVGMSGGVDSSVAALLLKKQGFDVAGVHIKMWSDPDIPCNFKEDRFDAMRVAAHLGIPFETWDLTREYREAVVEYMIREYAAGRTPNPDVMCNRHIKFGVFLERAQKLGAAFVATGHYVRKEGGKLFMGTDSNKDQSYFLWTLTREQIGHGMFPIGDYKKSEVRRLAQDFGLSTAQKPDSQGICFIGEIDIRDFLKKYIPVKPGMIKNSAGKIVGEHEGLPFYTIGQRHGLGVGGGIPYYVAKKDFSANTLTIAEGPYDEVLFGKGLIARDINWLSEAPHLPLSCTARIRYRQPVQSCRIELKDKKYTVLFDEPQKAITSGQSIVFYQKDEMLGGGVIDEVIPE